jgi:hypothetical protein
MIALPGSVNGKEHMQIAQDACLGRELGLARSEALDKTLAQVAHQEAD